MGCLVIVTRVKAMSQVLGFLMLENGILAFGLTLSRELPVLVETGVLMDVFVGVFIMAVVIRHIQLEFGSMNTRKLTALKE
jgi:hydrogenase-4 component E